MQYDDFLQPKKTVFTSSGFNAIQLNANLFDYQRAIVKWACKKGRACI